MEKEFGFFLKKALNDFVEAVVNIFIFLPYFFSVPTLLKTLFFPWKNLVTKKTTRGFSFSEWTDRFFFNQVSRTLGFFMRLFFLIFFLIILILYVVSLPIIFCVFVVLLPLQYLKVCLEKTEEEKKASHRQHFILNHLLNKENETIVNQWFEEYYKKVYTHAHWWKISNLLSYPPMGRDWAVGYTPTVDEYCEELTSPVYQNQIKTAFDREKEIDQMQRVLSKSQEANVLIVGEEGVGKHTIIDAFAKKIYEGKVNNLLAFKRVLKLNMEKILTQFTDQKQRENFFEELLYEATEAKNIILFIDDIDKYISSGSDRVDLSISLEKYARTSKIQIIGVTTPFFYQKFIFPNEKISRLLEKVDVFEISKSDAEKILLNATYFFEQRYQVIIPYESIKNTIDKSDFYITYIPFPEKAIDLLDSACTYVRQIKANDKQIVKITPEIIDKILTDKTHVPTSLTSQMKEKLLNLEDLLFSTIVQQEEAVKEVSSALRRSFLLIGKRKKPLASFLFLGPTGVGKTETAKAVTNTFFGSEKHLNRFDMSLYQSKNDIDNLIGSLDTSHPGLLAKAVRENPYGVLLLDEIEKADKDLINIFLTVLDEGYFTDGFGKRVDCKNLVIIATSNAGSDIIYQQKADANLINFLVEKKIFSPEFLNRFDGVITYLPLTETSIVEIARKMINKISDDIYKLYRVKLTVSDQFLKQIIEKGYDPKFGARNMERIIRKEIEDQVARLILENKAKEEEVINL